MRLMSAFNTHLRFDDEGGFPLALIDPLVYDSDYLHTTLIVPSGFQTDLASIPQILWNILPPIGKYDAAAVVHDFLYHQQPAGVRRVDADAVLREAMEVLGVRRLTRVVIWLGVRIGGWHAWKTATRYGGEPGTRTPKG